MANRLMTPDELAAVLAVSRHTILRWARAKRIPEVRPSERIRRFDYAEVMAAIHSMSSEGGGS